MDNIHMPKETIKRKPPNLQIFPQTMLFFSVAIFLFMGALLVSVFLIPSIVTAEAGFRSLPGLALAHTMTLGWITLLSMGASYQIMQILLRTSVFSGLLIYIQYVFYILGVAVTLPSLVKGNFYGIGVGGSLIIISVLIYAFNLAATVIIKGEWNVYVFGLGWSVLSLVATVFLGTCFPVAANVSAVSHWYNYIFESHLWLSLGGWVAGLIIAFSFKLLPMFYLSIKQTGKTSWYVISLWQVGIWGKAFSIWMESSVVDLISELLLVAGAILFAYYVFAIRKQARTVTGTIPVIGNINILFVVLFCLWRGQYWISLHSGTSSDWTTAFIYLLIVGWFSANILGYLARIIPFLWWAYRFHTKWNKKSAILLKDMVAEHRMSRFLYVYIVAVAMVAIAIPFSASILATAGQAIATVSAVIYFLALVRTFRH